MFEYMKFDSNPTFDVLAKTKDYIESNQLGKFEEKYYDDDYVLRGPGMLRFCLKFERVFHVLQVFLIPIRFPFPTSTFTFCLLE